MFFDVSIPRDKVQDEDPSGWILSFPEKYLYKVDFRVFLLLSFSETKGNLFELNFNLGLRSYEKILINGRISLVSHFSITQLLW